MRTTVASDAIVQEITIKASAERIFEALTNPDQRVKWWGSEGRFQTTHMESDLRPGGRSAWAGGRSAWSASIGALNAPACWSSLGCRIGRGMRPRASCASTWKRRTVLQPSA
jgi:Activator of Hsp90 ATPase homolog 1-like protein